MVTAKLGLSETTVHDYASVAKIWPDWGKFRKTAAKTGKFGRPLSWTHFVELTREQNGNRRRKLMAKARNQGWSVAELKAARMSESSESEESADAGDKNPETSGTSVAALDKVSSQLAPLSDADSWLSKAIKDIQPGKLAAERENLAKARQAAEKLCEVLGQCIEQIDLRLELVHSEQQPDEPPNAARKNQSNSKEEQTDTA